MSDIGNVRLRFALAVVQLIGEVPSLSPLRYPAIRPSDHRTGRHPEPALRIISSCLVVLAFTYLEMPQWHLNGVTGLHPSARSRRRSFSTNATYQDPTLPYGKHARLNGSGPRGCQSPILVLLLAALFPVSAAGRVGTLNATRKFRVTMKLGLQLLQLQVEAVHPKDNVILGRLAGSSLPL
jgi:hypothetical protein